MRRSGWFVSTANPDEVIEEAATRDYARMRASRLSKRLARRIFVWSWNPANGLRRVSSSADGGAVRWHRPCRWCSEQGCDSCEYLGSVVDEEAPVERF